MEWNYRIIERADLNKQRLGYDIERKLNELGTNGFKVVPFPIPDLSDSFILMERENLEQPAEIPPPPTRPIMDRLTDPNEHDFRV